MALSKYSPLLKVVILSLICILGVKPTTFLGSHKHQSLIQQFFYDFLHSAFATRLFSVFRHESVIHEVCLINFSFISFHFHHFSPIQFDPYFNFRSTKYLVEEGVYNFINWFDDASWYPLGRILGGTVLLSLSIST